jgi:hypothetical protein
MIIDQQVFFHAATAQVEPESSTGSSHTLKIPLQEWIIWDVGFFRNGGNLPEYGHRHIQCILIFDIALPKNRDK